MLGHHGSIAATVELGDQGVSKCAIYYLACPLCLDGDRAGTRREHAANNLSCGAPSLLRSSGAPGGRAALMDVAKRFDEADSRAGKNGRRRGSGQVLSIKRERVLAFGARRRLTSCPALSGFGCTREEFLNFRFPRWKAERHYSATGAHAH